MPLFSSYQILMMSLFWKLMHQDWALGQSYNPIAYFSKTLCPRNQALSIYEKELLAVITALDK